MRRECHRQLVSACVQKTIHAKWTTRTRHRIDQLQDAIDLAVLATRPMLIAELTGVNLTNAKRIFHEINGSPPPPGQFPFTDSWYLKRHRRMLHARILWRFYRQFRSAEQPPSKLWLSTYRSYQAHVADRLVDINRAYFIPRLITSGIWILQTCPACTREYPSPYEPAGSLCQACRVVRCAGSDSFRKES